jgi:hypothetical protein
MATHIENAPYYGDTKPAGGPLFNVWMPILAAVLSVILSIIVIATQVS